MKQLQLGIQEAKIWYLDLSGLHGIFLVHILAYMNIVKHINLDIEMFTFDFSYGIFHDRIAIYFTAWICIIATRGDHRDPLVQNSLGAPVHNGL